MSGDAQTLVHDAVLQAVRVACKPVPVFDNVPEGQDFPYLVLDVESEPFDTDTEVGQEHEITLHSYSRQRGRQECRDLNKKIYDALHDKDATLAIGAGVKLVSILYTFSSVFPDPDKQTFRGVIRFQAATSEI